MNNIIVKTRNLIGDFYEPMHDYFQVEDKTYFTLTNANVNSSSIIMYKNGILVDEEDYSFNVNTNKITWTPTTLTDDLVAGDLLDVSYSAYSKFSENEIKGYIKAALTNLSVYGYGTFIIETETDGEEIISPTPTEYEENLIAVVASILINPPLKQYKTAEITFTFADDMSKEEKINQSINQHTKTFGYFSYNPMSEINDTCEEEEDE